MAALSLDAEQVLGAAKEQLTGCGLSDVVVVEFLPAMGRVSDAYIHRRWGNRANGWLG